MNSFLNLSQRPDIINAYLDFFGFTEEEKEIAKGWLETNSTQTLAYKDENGDWKIMPQPNSD